MGATLDKPITEKVTENGVANGIQYGFSSMQGWRLEQEDAHTIECDIPSHPGFHFYAIYDGHGGSTVSNMSATNLLPKILAVPAFKNGDKHSVNTWATALHDGLLAFDADLKTIPRLQSLQDHSGSTAITLFLTPSHVIFGNCGDSRGLIARAGVCFFATADHKPSNPEETARVLNAGGSVEFGRVCGNLAVSRALGDFQYKDSDHLPAEKQKVSADADITIFERTAEDEFVILACDGIWDVMSNQQAVTFVTEHLKAGCSPREIAEKFLDHCLEKNSKDNMSVAIILMPNAPKPVPGYQIAVHAQDAEDEERIRHEAEQGMHNL